MGGMDNRTSTEMSSNFRKMKSRMSGLYRGWYEEYKNHPTYQYQMTYLEFKKLKRKEKKRSRK